jgi:hypothetical protein
MGQRGDTSVSRKQPQSHQLEGLDQTQEDNGQQSETDLSSVQHQIWESGLQTEQVNTLVQHRSGKAVSADPLATVTQSCKSDQTISRASSSRLSEDSVSVQNESYPATAVSCLSASFQHNLWRVVDMS